MMILIAGYFKVMLFAEYVPSYEINKTEIKFKGTCHLVLHALSSIIE